MNRLLARIAVLDLSVDQALSWLRRPGSARVMALTTILGSGYFCFPVYTLVLGLARESSFPVLIPVLGAEAILFPLIAGLRMLTRRERPLARAARPWEAWNRYSFPSYHAARIWMLALACSLHFPGVAPFALGLAVVVSASRLTLRRHYLSDILAGSFLGGLAYCAGAVLSAHLGMLRGLLTYF